MSSYSISLRNDKRKQYERFALFILLINLVVFVFIAIAAADERIRYTAISAAVLLLIFLLADRYSAAKRNRHHSPFKISAFIIAALSWVIINNFWSAALLLVLNALYIISQRKLQIIISEPGVYYPSFPSRNFEWEQLNNLVLRDGMLTIDCRNNVLIQQHIDEKKTPVNEQEFNDFCRAQMRK